MRPLKFTFDFLCKNKGDLLIQQMKLANGHIAWFFYLL